MGQLEVKDNPDPIIHEVGCLGSVGVTRAEERQTCGSVTPTQSWKVRSLSHIPGLHIAPSC